jgi:nucleoside-diphosphate-sugar epimerase
MPPPTRGCRRSEVRATSGKGFVRLMAEHEWLHLFYNYQAPVHIFRCGGIYGPRRSAIEAVRHSGLPSASQRRRARQQYTARVHVYDICQTIEASVRHPNAGVPWLPYSMPMPYA